jgi:hypothetical protein
MLENPININLINQNVENPNKNKIPIQLKKVIGKIVTSRFRFTHYHRLMLGYGQGRLWGCSGISKSPEQLTTPVSPCKKKV